MRGSSNVDSALFDTKIFGFFKIHGVYARIREVKSVRTFCAMGEGSIFRNFVRTSFMDGSFEEMKSLVA